MLRIILPRVFWASFVTVAVIRHTFRAEYLTLLTCYLSGALLDPVARISNVGASVAGNALPNPFFWTRIRTFVKPFTSIARGLHLASSNSLVVELLELTVGAWRAPSCLRFGVCINTLSYSAFRLRNALYVAVLAATLIRVGLARTARSLCVLCVSAHDLQCDSQNGWSVHEVPVKAPLFW